MSFQAIAETAALFSLEQTNYGCDASYYYCIDLGNNKYFAIPRWISYIFYVIFFGIGVLYCFFGGKFYPILHGVICGIESFLFFAIFVGILSTNLTVGVITGIICGALIGYGCFRAKRYQAFVLGI